MKASRSAVPDRADEKWTLYQSAWPWLELKNISVDVSHTLQESISLNQAFEPYTGHLSEGWSMFRVGGPVEIWNSELIENSGAITDWSPDLPPSSAVRKLVESLSFVKITGAQILRLHPGGVLHPHADKTLRRLDRLVIPLNHPPGAVVEFEQWGEIPYRPGHLFLIDTSWIHMARNGSNEDRYHLQLTFDLTELTPTFKKTIIESTLKF